MNYAGSKKGIILNDQINSLKGGKENYTHDRKLVKEV
jgi:hypothetical protein